MKKHFYKTLLSCLLLSVSMFSHASPGDTLKVQTFTFGSPQDAWFVFPSDTMHVNKILMYYTLKCNPAQNPACGEWDYQTSTYLYEHTGRLDSTLLNAPSFKVDGGSPDSLQFMFQPSWKYSPHFNTSIAYSSVTAFDSAVIGNGSFITPTPFNSAWPESRSQFLWKSAELLAVGLQAGNISGLRFNIQSAGSQLKNLTIRIKHTNLNSLTSSCFENSGFTIVYANNTAFSFTGWNTIHFIDPFVWNGTDNIIIDISFDNPGPGTANSVYSENTGLKTGITAAGNDKSLFFMGSDFVNVPKESMAAVDSFITVAFWAYGNPPYQPQNQSLFEAFDSLGRRVINVHLPWSDNNIYWDAGNSGTTSYDRINKTAVTDEIEGKWNYWAFTKNVANGTLKIYKNGLLWHSGTGFTRRMYGIKNFKIGSDGNGTNNYDGNVDEFAVWNAELDSATIHKWMYRDLNASHPYNNKLQLYYKFNDNALLTAADSAAGGYTGTLNGLPVYQFTKGSEIVRNFQETSLRPNVIFEQGTYVSHIDTLISIDSVQTDPKQVYFYSDSLNPLTCTDTITIWPSYYSHYIYNHLGIATDSAFVIPDSTIHLKHWYYYSPHFEVINRYEMQRFITPYGNNLSLGNGFTWVTDVSDYRSLLHDTVHLSAGNWQELLDVRFDFIKGTPPRDPLTVQNLWNGNFNFGYASDPIEDHLTPKKVFIPASAKSVRWKSRITGHGMDTPENCAEFCPKYHYFKVNGTQQYQRLVWREDCGLNPVYPQGGTWIYSRANWCPGSDVKTYDLELTPFLTPNDTAILDHDVEPYIHTGSWSYYEIEDQLITYDKANFVLDAELYDVIRPSRAQIYSRMNPVCNNPVVTIRNTGSTTLTSLDIIYGVEGSGTQPSVFHWQGNLKFMEMENVTLEQVQWTGSNGTFYATVSAPNGGTDMYPYNNTVKTFYSAPPEFPASFVIEFKTNSYPNENSYTLKDDQGNIILQKSTFAANTIYRDTVHLNNGCYDFTLYDSDDDGLSFWANDDGSGYIRFRRANNSQIIKTWNPDFGAQAFTQFTVGYYLNHEEITAKESIELYPNPTSGQFTLDIVLPTTQDISLTVFDYHGKACLKQNIKSVFDKKVQVDLSKLASGMYFINILTESGVTTKKLILDKQGN
jgi:hypothetical protein